MLRVTEVAGILGISGRSVYRLIREGLLPASVKPRGIPVYGYEIDPNLVARIKRKLKADGLVATPNVIRAILKEMEGG